MRVLAQCVRQSVRLSVQARPDRAVSTADVARWQPGRDRSYTTHPQWSQTARRAFADRATDKLASHRRRSRNRALVALGVAVGLGTAAFIFVPPFQHFVIAVQRCSRVGVVVFQNILSYKWLFRQTWPGEDEDSERGERARQKRHEDYQSTHARCANRIYKVLLANGGIYIKLGQHLSTIQLVPEEWQAAMRPLQDRCEATPVEEVARLFLTDVGHSVDTLFSSFEREPIGVASLAQVHIATDRETGRKVAVKIMHPNLETFALVDMKTTSFMLRVVKRVFPSFEFTWLGEEMEENLPREMNFVHEAYNARRCAADFAGYRKTSIVVPEILWAKKRILVMEYIEGARVDNLEYLAKHNIDRNRVAQELSRIFATQLLVHGRYHADPHAGNLLIRPRQAKSRSPYNFEIVLLDHGLWMEIDDQLRTDYARLWLALLAPPTKQVRADRRRYAKSVGNIGDDLYPIFESAITGRSTLADDEDSDKSGSILDLATQTPEEAHKMRESVVKQGMVTDIFDLLRRVPKKLLYVLKLNDLTRSLDQALETTHPPMRVWIIFASFCAKAVYLDDLHRLRQKPVSRSRIFALARTWFAYRRWSFALTVAEITADFQTLLTHFYRFFARV